MKTLVAGTLVLLATCAALRAQTPPNVLLIIADDLGVDRVACYHEHPDPGHTPVIDDLAAHGMLFRRAWALPVCSPTRVSMMIGQEPFRHGIGLALDEVQDTLELWPGETTLPEVLAPDYASVCFGKWHMSVDTFDPLHAAAKAGFAHYLGNLTIFPGFIGDGYYDFDKDVDGTVVHSTTYDTTDIVNDALAVLPTLKEPWFTWLAFNAPHSPFHKPPPNLHTFVLPPNVQDDVPLHMKAMVEAMDTEMGRLFATLDPALLSRTVVVFLGDNGTDKPVTTAPWLPSHAKGTLYDGGVRVPLIVAGPGIAPGTECDALVQVTDLFATIADLAGKPHPTGLDSVSLVPYFSAPTLPSLRKTLHSELFEPVGFGPYTEEDRAARDDRFKLIRFQSGAGTHEELYDLDDDPFEQTNLLLSALSPEAAASYAVLEPALDPAPETWNLVGEGVPDAAGEPQLSGSGSLQAGQVVTLSLQSGAAFAPTALMIGTDWFGKPFKDGVLGPKPVLLVPGLLTDAGGALQLVSHWPPGVPPQFRLLLQAWIVDPSASHGLAASNNLIATVP